jgi:hypothetical protein
MACAACLPLGDIPSPKPAAFPNQEELRVRQADGGANDQSNSDLPTISSRRTDLLADGGLRQMHALGGAREALGLATATKAVQFEPRLLPRRRAFIQIVTSFLAPAHWSVLLTLDVGFPPNRFARSTDDTAPTAETFLYESERSDAKYISTASIFNGVRRKWSRNARSDEMSSYHQRQPALGSSTGSSFERRRSSSIRSCTTLVRPPPT